jgi:hypothetical protein
MDSRRTAAPRPLSALPSVRARAVAFACILVAGTCGALIGYSFVKLQCHGACTTPMGLGAVGGGTVAAVGVAVVAVLTLRAMAEWHTIKAERAAELEAARAAAAAGEAEAPAPGAGVRTEVEAEPPGPSP